MKKIIISIIILVVVSVGCTKEVKSRKIEKNAEFGLVIHGGAGNIVKEKMPEEFRLKYEEKLKEALDAGYAVLEKGGESLDAVQIAINILEDSPLFNANVWYGLILFNDVENSE